jgi:hypothetical protein
VEDSCNTIDFGTVESSVIFDLDSVKVPTFSPKLQAKSGPVPYPISIPAVPKMVLPESRAFNFSNAVGNNTAITRAVPSSNFTPTAQFAWQKTSFPVNNL